MYVGGDLDPCVDAKIVWFADCSGALSNPLWGQQVAPKQSKYADWSYLHPGGYAVTLVWMIAVYHYCHWQVELPQEVR